MGSDTDAQDVLSRYIDALTHDGDFGRYLAEDVHWTTMETGEEMRGRETVVGFIQALHTQLFDAHVEVRTVLAVDGTGLLEAVFVGTHIGEVAGVPPTGASVRLPYVVVYDIADGQITAIRGYLSIAALVGQLRAVAGAPAG